MSKKKFVGRTYMPYNDKVVESVYILMQNKKIKKLLKYFKIRKCIYLVNIFIYYLKIYIFKLY